MGSSIQWQARPYRFDGAVRGSGGAAGQHTALSGLLQLLGAAADDLSVPAEAVPVAVRSLRAGDTLFHEGARSEAIYFVRCGSFKTLRTAQDGYEQVLGFAARAEVLGFDALCTGAHPSTAAALEDSSVYAVLVQDVFSLDQRLPALGRAVHLAISRALARLGELADVMAAVAAEVRLARFLTHLSQHMAACGESPRRLYLRMGRRDIASYLGVAHETVSRSFGALADWGLVRVANREVEILDPAALDALTGSTRRPVDIAGSHGSIRFEHVRFTSPCATFATSQSAGSKALRHLPREETAH